MQFHDIDSLSREKLLELCKIYAKNWLAHDGCWFLSIEQKRGMEEAMEHDANAWRQFTAIEARRLKEFLGLSEYAGVEGLALAFRFRLQASLNQPEVTIDGDTVTYRARRCRTQDARKRKGLDDFPCLPVGLEEYTGFAKAIDPRFETEVISCPPSLTEEGAWCVWKFTLKKDPETV